MSDVKVKEIKSLDDLMVALLEGGVINDSFSVETPGSATMKRAEAVGLSEEAKTMFQALCDAGADGTLAILQCTENATGRVVPVLVLTRPSEATGGVDMMPIGVLFDPATDDDPCSKYTPVGGDIATIETEKGRAKREAVAAEV